MSEGHRQEHRGVGRHTKSGSSHPYTTRAERRIP